MTEIKKLWAYLKNYRLYFFAALIFIILNVVFSMIPGYLNRRIIDDVIRGQQLKLLFSLLTAYVIATLLRSIAIMLQRFFTEILSQNLLKDLKQALYEKLQKLSFNFYNKNRTGELMSRMTGDMEAIRMLFADGMIQFTRAIFYLIFVVLVLIQENIALTLVSICLSPLIGFFAYRLGVRIKPIFRQVRRQYSDLNSTVQENISGIRIVKAFHQQAFEMEKFSEENNSYFIKNYRAAQIWSKYFPIMEFLGGMSTVLLLFYGGRLVISGEITLGVWMQFNSYLWMLIMPMRMIGPIVNMFSRTSASAERIFNILEKEPEIKNIAEPIKATKIAGKVEFKNVGLSYGDEVILKNISFLAEPGQTIAIMGTTGSGKTSLVNLIPRFYEATSGEVLIDGRDNRSYDLYDLRQQISVVMQEVFLFSETIANNIAYGRPEVGLEKIKSAAEISSARDFIEEMEAGFEEVIGERGMGLSGGQKQRVSLARALVQESPILIMDDATSAVDMETEHQIQQALESRADKSTVFLIAHRISSVRNADQILILNDGEIIERGTHAELIKQQGHYYKMFKEQYKEVMDEAEIAERWVD
ncbi:ABC transporter ATP-binding protein [Halanaerobium salsuginis]|jgi:ATP-binding cassette subfamily B protein|uniref:ATP-binding cassette, subfamily B n=1 Tax=Halanaerobium salsuginis TaxID=29563 RepID=A0A1I4JUB0_9FIRM|nr:ABC transporter ATP-binding protein [Halanaerobium salsuginis]SFL70139.1 ATP-binding cassette, subfamily B [Halanaerobium salsuginis]